MSEFYTVSFQKSSGMNRMWMDLDVQIDEQSDEALICRRSSSRVSAMDSSNESGQILDNYPGVPKDRFVVAYKEGNSIESSIQQYLLDLTSEYGYSVCVSLKNIKQDGEKKNGS